MTNLKDLAKQQLANPRPVADIKAAMVEAMQPDCKPTSAPVSDYDDLVTRVKIALDDHDNPAVLARVLFGLGINDARPVKGKDSTNALTSAVRVGKALLLPRQSGDHWYDWHSPGRNHGRIAAAIVKAHRQSVEVQS